MPTIVVGVDGSPPSLAALRWAVEEARLRGAVLRAVHAWQLAVLGGHDAPHLDPEFVRRETTVAERVLTRALAHVRLEAEDVEVEARTIEGRASAVLVEAAGDADLLVLGSRGRGGFAGLLLGSVSQQCAHHAACPVVIVRDEPAAA